MCGPRGIVNSKQAVNTSLLRQHLVLPDKSIGHGELQAATAADSTTTGVASRPTTPLQTINCEDVNDHQTNHETQMEATDKVEASVPEESSSTSNCSNMSAPASIPFPDGPIIVQTGVPLRKQFSRKRSSDERDMFDLYSMGSVADIELEAFRLEHEELSEDTPRKRRSCVSTEISPLLVFERMMEEEDDEDDDFY